MKKSVYKFITVDNYEKEEVFLKEMALKGWQFYQYKGLKYHFEKSESQNMDYRIDYFDGEKSEKDDYIQLFEDSGWTLVTTYPIFDGEWYYFTKVVSDNEANEIFTDVDSKITLFEKIRTRWSIYGFLTAAFFPFILMISLPRGILFINVLLIILFSVVIILYTKMWINLTLKIKRLKQ